MSRRGGFFGSLATGFAGGLAQSTKDIGRRLIESQRYADAQKRYQEREATRQAERREMMDMQKAMRDAQEQKYLFDRAASMIPQSQRARAFAETGGNLAGATPEQLRGYADAARQQQLDDYNRELEGRKQLLRMQLAARNRGRGQGPDTVLGRMMTARKVDTLKSPLKSLYDQKKALTKQSLVELDSRVRDRIGLQIADIDRRLEKAVPAIASLTDALEARRRGMPFNQTQAIQALQDYGTVLYGVPGTAEEARALGAALGIGSPTAKLPQGISNLPLSYVRQE